MKKIKCKNCGEVKIHKALGLCSKCYDKKYYDARYKSGKKKKVIKRNCLKCDVEFIIEYDDNWICSKCRERNANIYYEPLDIHLNTRI